MNYLRNLKQVKIKVSLRAISCLECINIWLNFVSLFLFLLALNKSCFFECCLFFYWLITIHFIFTIFIISLVKIFGTIKLAEVILMQITSIRLLSMVITKFINLLLLNRERSSYSLIFIPNTWPFVVLLLLLLL